MLGYSISSDPIFVTHGFIALVQIHAHVFVNTHATYVITVCAHSVLSIVTRPLYSFMILSKFVVTVEELVSEKGQG